MSQYIPNVDQCGKSYFFSLFMHIVLLLSMIYPNLHEFDIVNGL